MRLISVSPCKHFDCSNRNSFGYCKTTVCINEHYQQEQWGSPSTTNKSESVVKKLQTNADRIMAMSDEKLAEWFWGNDWIYLKTKSEMLDWLKQEVSDDS